MCRRCKLCEWSICKEFARIGQYLLLSCVYSFCYTIKFNFKNRNVRKKKFNYKSKTRKGDITNDPNPMLFTLIKENAIEHLNKNRFFPLAVFRDRCTSKVPN